MQPLRTHLPGCCRRPLELRFTDKPALCWSLSACTIAPSGALRPFDPPLSLQFRVAFALRLRWDGAMRSLEVREARIEAEAKTPWAVILGVIAMLSVFAIAQGLTHPLLSFILKRQGTPTSLIG